MTSNNRYLNKIVLINAATYDYQEVDLNGNICFIGTNNAGKTTLLRSLLFFYNGDTNRLGISMASNKKRFEEYYFPTDTSYLIYEVKTETQAFHILAYRKNFNAIFFRFFDCPYNKDYYVDNQTILNLDEIRTRFDKQHIGYSNQVETYKQYRNILYGNDSKENRRFALLRGNNRFHNIPKAISDIFLSSQAVIKSEFVKDFIVNSISEKVMIDGKEENLSISLTQISNKLKTFEQGYDDIKTYLEDKQCYQKRNLILEQYDRLKILKLQLQELATDLGSAVKYAEQERIQLSQAMDEKDVELNRHKSEYEFIEQQISNESRSLTESLGEKKAEIRKANSLKVEYEKKGIYEKLAKFDNRIHLENQLKAKQNEYQIQTSLAQEIELRFAMLFSQLDNEKNVFQNQLISQGFELEKQKNENLNAKREFYHQQIERIKETENTEIEKLNDKFSSLKIDLERLRNEQRFIEQKQYFVAESAAIANEKISLEKSIIEKKGEIQVKEGKILALSKEFETFEKQLDRILAETREKTRKEIESYQKESLNLESQTQKEMDTYAQNLDTQKNKLVAEVSLLNQKIQTHHQTLYGFLDLNLPDWKNSIGKVCTEDVLFLTIKDLNPKIVANQSSLYGLELELSQLPILARNISDYESERNDKLQKINLLEQDYLDFEQEKTEILTRFKNETTQKIRVLEENLIEFPNQQGEEKRKLSSKLGKERSDLNDSIQHLRYQIEQAEKRLQQIDIELSEWKNKISHQRNEDLRECSELQNTKNLEILAIRTQIQDSKNTLNQKIEVLREELKTISIEFENQYQTQKASSKERLDSQLKEYENRRLEYIEQKNEALGGKGIDETIIKTLSKQINDLELQLSEIKFFEPLINNYKRDKEELFDKLDELITERKQIENDLRKNEESLKTENAAYQQGRVKIDRDKKLISRDLDKYLKGLEFYNETFTREASYVLLEPQILGAELKAVEKSIDSLCFAIINNQKEYYSTFDKFRESISEFLARFNRPENTFNFSIPTNASESDCIRFVEEPNLGLKAFENENKIDVYKNTVNIHHLQLLKIISESVKALLVQENKIDKTVASLEKDFERAEFGESKLIEYIKLRKQSSNNEILNSLKRIEKFNEEYGYLLAENNLFVQNEDFKVKVVNKIIDMLADLGEKIKKDKLTDVRLQDLFDLQFKIKEGKNVIDWTDKITDIGSTGTDILVKAIIYITLLNLFIGESLGKTEQKNYFIHCIIDEVGQIAAPYLKELLAFAKQRNIYLINGLPNESKLETQYNITYKIRRTNTEHSKVIKLTTNEIIIE